MQPIKGTAMILAILATTACQGFPFHMGMQERATTVAPDMTSYFAQRLDDGRRHLAAQRPGAALTAFRQASYHADFAGEAYNGMAIAYDRMGRYDLAHQFFAQAVEAAPDDPRFARNAARFDEAMLARREEDAVPQQLAVTRENARSPRLASSADLARLAETLDVQLWAPPPERMRQVTPGQVQIASREDWSARLASSAGERPAVLHVGAPPQAETQLAESLPTYPVSIALASVRTDVAGQERQVRGGRDGSRFVDPQGEVRVRVSGNRQPYDRQAYPVVVRLSPAS